MFKEFEDPDRAPQEFPAPSSFETLGQELRPQRRGSLARSWDKVTTQLGMRQGPQNIGLETGQQDGANPRNPGRKQIWLQHHRQEASEHWPGFQQHERSQRTGGWDLWGTGDFPERAQSLWVQRPTQ